MQIRPQSTPQTPKKIENPVIGTYDEGITDLADKVTLNKQARFEQRAEATAFAQQNPGAEMVVESREQGGKLGYDVYSVTIHDKGQSLKSAAEMKHLQLFDRPLQGLAESTGQDISRAFFVTEDGVPQADIYNSQFDRTTFDKMRETLGLDDNKHWFGLVDKYMSAPSPADALPDIQTAEIQDMKSQLSAGDIVMTGNNGSFIHAIIYVGQDPELQAQLEAKWGLEAGALKDEGLIMHALAVDEDTETRKAGGTGVVLDTIESYLERHPRDTMIAVEVKGATDADRKAVIEAGKAMVGRDYDNGFNTFDDENIYCTEFVFKSWMNAPDTDAQFDNQLFPLIPKTSAPVSGWLYDKLPDSMQTLMKDDGYLYQEMMMTDGIVTSPAVEIKWANQHADQSEFFQKHERWADGIEGKVSKGYKNLLEDNVPDQARRSQGILDKIRAQSDATRERMAVEE